MKEEEVYKEFSPQLKDSEIDVIYDLVDGLCHSENWLGLNDIFIRSPQFLRIDFILSMLVSTNPVKQKLPSRKKFLEDCVTIYGSELFEGLK